MVPLCSPRIKRGDAKKNLEKLQMQKANDTGFIPEQEELFNVFFPRKPAKAV